VVIVLALPWRSHQLGAVPGFPGPGIAAVVGCALLTILLLFSLYRGGGSPRLLVLGWAYLWSAGGALLIGFATPGLAQSDPSFAADLNSAQWLWVSWHVVPPALIGLALAPWPDALGRVLGAHRGRRVALSWVVTILLIVLVAALIAKAPHRLPTIIDSAGRLGDAVLAAVLVVNLAVVAVAVRGVARRNGEGVERWAVVASVAFLGDVALNTLHEPRFSVAFYLARVLALASSAFVLLAILRENARLLALTSETARRLEERNAELLEATRLRDHLTAVVSHDLRTPLAGLQGYLEMLRDDDLESPLAKRMLERSWMLTRRLTLLAEDLLSAVTLEHHDLVVTPEPLDLNQQLGECATCFPDLDLELDCPPGLAAYADPLRLQQILANLVRNAQKHGAEPVLIAATPDPAGSGGVTIRVSDAGPGVPATFVPRLFDRYSQGTVTATGGSGLGLSVVRDLVSAHHGAVRYEPAGNAFVVTLPPLPARKPLGVVDATAPDADRAAPSPV
jgi:signal transduction histidine kinase